MSFAFGKGQLEFVLGSNIDAISGATISANSIMDDLNTFEGLVEEIIYNSE